MYCSKGCKEKTGNEIQKEKNTLEKKTIDFSVSINLIVFDKTFIENIFTFYDIIQYDCPMTIHFFLSFSP